LATAVAGDVEEVDRVHFPRLVGVLLQRHEQEFVEHLLGIPGHGHLYPSFVGCEEIAPGWGLALKGSPAAPGWAGAGASGPILVPWGGKRRQGTPSGVERAGAGWGAKPRESRRAARYMFAVPVATSDI